MQDKPSGDISPEDRTFLDEIILAVRDRAGGRVPASWRRHLSDTLKEHYKPPPRKRGRKPCTDRHVEMAKDFEIETMWGVSRSKRDPRPVRSIEKRLAEKHGISLSRFRDAHFKYKDSPEVRAARAKEIQKASEEPRERLKKDFGDPSK